MNSGPFAWINIPLKQLYPNHMKFEISITKEPFPFPQQADDESDQDFNKRQISWLENMQYCNRLHCVIVDVANNLHKQCFSPPFQSGNTLGESIAYSNVTDFLKRSIMGRMSVVEGFENPYAPDCPRIDSDAFDPPFGTSVPEKDCDAAEGQIRPMVNPSVVSEDGKVVEVMEFNLKQFLLLVRKHLQESHGDAIRLRNLQIMRVIDRDSVLMPAVYVAHINQGQRLMNQLDRVIEEM